MRRKNRAGRHVSRRAQHLPGIIRLALQGDDHAVEESVEKGKKKFAGYELPGRALGVVGLGAIGVEVANAALGLRMKVLGYDPQITVQRAWQLSSGVEQALSLDDLFARSDMISVHVPLNDHTRGLVNAARLKLMRRGGVILNFARAQIVDEAAVIEGMLDSCRLRPRFPTVAVRTARVVHCRTASTGAEENCAIMVANTA
jgi:D-3-phosphoglycerate dehydrogenase